MRIVLHIGPEHVGAGRLQKVLGEKRAQLRAKGVLMPASPGPGNHTRLVMAMTDPDHVDPLRAARGFASAVAQEALRARIARELTAEIAAAGPDTLILSAAELATTLERPAEVARLAAFLRGFSDDIRLVAHLDEQARVLMRHYAQRLFLGRTAALSRELAMAGAADWRDAALAARADMAEGRFAEIEAPPLWLDYVALKRLWEREFGTGSLVLRPYTAEVFAAPEVTNEIRAAFGLPFTIGRAATDDPGALPSARSMARARALNAGLWRLAAATGHHAPRALWASLVAEVTIPGSAPDPGALSAISERFAADNAGLAAGDTALAAALAPCPPAPDWTEPDTGEGFRVTQYLAAFRPRIERAARAEAAQAAATPQLSDEAERLLPPAAKARFFELMRGPFRPHDHLGATTEAGSLPPFPERTTRPLPAGSTGRVIVACMKNEAPYILEWIAYHRAIGVDGFLVYTNGCEDGTDEILARLAELGIVEHRLNDDWKGKSPQQHALNRAMREPLVRRAEWVIHIDVDEFINVRIGDGTLDAFLAAVPGATNVAMTWRLFGHGGVRAFEDRPVIAQFTRCAPRHCPKPHTAWGFKTMTRNNGVYAKLSCHRPNKPDAARMGEIRWVNGAGRQMGRGVAERGWRSTRETVGYELLQLNHYALRSAESFLVKRQRGRALHVDRSIGLGYWIRMDWNDVTDLTIQRNLPRLKAGMADLMADPALAGAHAAGVDWHRRRVARLRAEPEFEALYRAIIETRLAAGERAAYALSLEMDS